MRACQKMRWNFARSAPSFTAASSRACELTMYARASSGAIAQRAKWRDFASPIPRMRSVPSAIGFARENDHLLVVGMPPVAPVRHRQARALAGAAERVEVVVVLVAVGIGDDPLGLLDLAEELLSLRVLVDRRVEPAAR